MHLIHFQQKEAKNLKMPEMKEELNPVQHVRQKYFNTQSEFASWLSSKIGRNVTRVTVSRWENWSQTPNNEVRRLLAKYTGLTERKIYLIFKDEIKRRKKEDDYRRGNKKA